MQNREERVEEHENKRGPNTRGFDPAADELTGQEQLAHLARVPSSPQPIKKSRALPAKKLRSFALSFPLLPKAAIAVLAPRLLYGQYRETQRMGNSGSRCSSFRFCHQ